jgi:hypothetical protein
MCNSVNTALTRGSTVTVVMTLRLDYTTAIIALSWRVSKNKKFSALKIFFA